MDMNRWSVQPGAAYRGAVFFACAKFRVVGGGSEPLSKGPLAPIADPLS